MTKDLKILGTHWVLNDGVTELPTDTMLGHMDALAHTISLRADVFPSWKLYLLLHETIHAMSFLGHLQFIKAEDGFHDDEAKVDAIASLLAHFITSNKPLIDELISGD